jgi:hypothetical protein
MTLPPFLRTGESIELNTRVENHLELLVPIGKLRQFGYGRLIDRFPSSLGLAGQLGPRPTLVVIARPPGGPTLAHSPGFYDEFFFDPNQQGSYAWVMNAYGAGPKRVLNGPPPVLDLSASVAALGLPDRAAAIMKMIIDAGALSALQSVDDTGNNDDILTTGELLLIIVDTYSSDLGVTTPFTLNDGPMKISAMASFMGHETSLQTACHEVFHQWGAIDLYGGNFNINPGLTLMAATIFSIPDDRSCVELDPWHRLQFGVTAPSLVDFATQPSGQIEIRSVTADRASSAVLFWDSRQGKSDYFLVELREPAAGTVDGNVHDGIAVWMVHLDANGNPESPGGGIPGVAAIGKNRDLGSPFLWTDGEKTHVLSWSDGSLSSLELAFVRPSPGRAIISWSTVAIRPPLNKIPKNRFIKNPIVAGIQARIQIGELRK